MVSPLSGGLQQPFGTLYQPGGPEKTDSRVEDRKPQRREEPGKPESGRDIAPAPRAERSESSEKSTSVSYAKNAGASSRESGESQRGELLDITV
ncbi:MAG: hypothetical protein H6862_00340 [Rhodospirillales bacterium]|nr:hypothetical protein [Rhodospirillales bacterium]